MYYTCTHRCTTPALVTCTTLSCMCFTDMYYTVVTVCAGSLSACTTPSPLAQAYSALSLFTTACV
eukprot:JP437859.1.p2 GENE.JP437859.1~~JP437859.1.p2  ORF type:complete len:65 (+),score=1.77 JP437859.1:56-250(+)